MRTAESAVITFGCSLVRNSSDWQALTSQSGTWETVVTPKAQVTLDVGCITGGRAGEVDDA